MINVSLNGAHWFEVPALTPISQIMAQIKTNCPLLLNNAEPVVNFRKEFLLAQSNFYILSVPPSACAGEFQAVAFIHKLLQQCPDADLSQFKREINEQLAQGAHAGFGLVQCVNMSYLSAKLDAFPVLKRFVQNMQSISYFPEKTIIAVQSPTGEPNLAQFDLRFETGFDNQCKVHFNNELLIISYINANIKQIKEKLCDMKQIQNEIKMFNSFGTELGDEEDVVKEVFAKTE
ncbi:Hypothetical_protein [Hexamita inflata]|uniref:Hypothetical_protein n=1 Tax=Hexamita inflata TaxID=28002 RepID=A0AA86PI98_9EUKA|nr:Hypothetical protein HINF_LOCUS23439 [Hexamita inflata]